ncbi:MAG: hypothetical protein R3286_19360 [Gammaproteobacteria bacterium]|nr:hypothetical protein [Gammaproteobacteria bacterium]
MIDAAKPVRVFRNWKRGCYNIMQGGQVVATARQVRLADVEFRVREPGRQRMLRLRRRNVHAYAIGHLLDHVHPLEQRSLGGVAGRSAFYDPWRFATFVDGESHRPVRHAHLVQLDERGVTYVSEPAPAALDELDEVA